MADDGNEPSSDDLWANTRPEGAPAPGAASPGPTPPDPTLVQPVVAGPNLPPSAPPPGPPAGPPGAPPPPPGNGDDPDGPPPWLLPAAAAMIGLLVIGLVIALLVRDDGEGDTTSTSLPLIGTTTPSTVASPNTTPPPETTAPSQSAEGGSTSAPPTTEAATTTTIPATTTTATTTTTTATTTTTTTTSTTSTTTTTTTAPAPPLPDPGFAVIDGTTTPITTACLVIPLEPNTADYQVASYLVATDGGRLVLDRWADEGGANGLDATTDDGEPLDTVSLDTDSFTGAFSAVLRRAAGDATIEVSLNPGPGQPADCADVVRTRDADATELSQYTHAVLDVCTVRPAERLLDVAGIGSEGARFTVDDNGDGTAELRFSDRRVDDLVDPDATVTIDELTVTYTGLVSGAGNVRSVFIELRLDAPRSCDPSEAP